VGLTGTEDVPTLIVATGGREGRRPAPVINLSVGESTRGELVYEKAKFDRKGTGPEDLHSHMRDNENPALRLRAALHWIAV
jgi:hypothetical protein